MIIASHRTRLTSSHGKDASDESVLGGEVVVHLKQRTERTVRVLRTKVVADHRRRNGSIVPTRRSGIQTMPGTCKHPVNGTERSIPPRS